MKKHLLWAMPFVIILGSISLFARPPKEHLATPGFRDDGVHVVPFMVTVGSQGTVQPYVPNNDTDRAYYIVNPDTYDLLIGTFPFFTSTDNYAYIVKGSSGSITLFNSATYYLRLAPNASSDTVRGSVSKQ